MAFRRRRHQAHQSVPTNPFDPANSLFNPNKLDLVATSASAVNLYIIQDQAWIGTDAEIQSLQQKIHNYVAYARDGQMANQYPQSVGKPWRIVIDSYVGEPNQTTLDILQGIGDAVRGYSGDLILHLLKPPPVGEKMPTSLRAIRMGTGPDGGVEVDLSA
jgi:hypothetical protein